MSRRENLRNEVAGAAERFVPSEMAGTQTEAQHVARYVLAASLANGRRVLDAGCGVGYGTELISAAGATSALGIDISAEAITSAREATRSSTTFVVGDLRDLESPAGAFDLVVCFEVLEHIADQDAVVDELSRVTAPDGLLLVSSPNRDVYLPGNPHHVRELLPEELRALIARRFRHVELLRQHDWVTSAVLNDDALAIADVDVPIELNARKVAAVAPGDETYTVAMASDGELKEAHSAAVLGTTVEIRQWQEGADKREATLERQVAEVLDAHADLNTQVLAIGDDLQASRVELAMTAAQLGGVRNERDHLRGVIEAMKASSSWRLTAPLRALKRHKA